MKGSAVQIRAGLITMNEYRSNVIMYEDGERAIFHVFRLRLNPLLESIHYDIICKCRKVRWTGHTAAEVGTNVELARMYCECGHMSSIIYPDCLYPRVKEKKTQKEEGSKEEPGRRGILEYVTDKFIQRYRMMVNKCLESLPSLNR